VEETRGTGAHSKAAMPNRCLLWRTHTRRCINSCSEDLKLASTKGEVGYPPIEPLQFSVNLSMVVAGPRGSVRAAKEMEKGRRVAVGGKCASARSAHLQLSKLT
jgi:hypothetical protein